MTEEPATNPFKMLIDFAETVINNELQYFSEPTWPSFMYDEDGHFATTLAEDQIVIPVFPRSEDDAIALRSFRHGDDYFPGAFDKLPELIKNCSESAASLGFAVEKTKIRLKDLEKVILQVLKWEEDFFPVTVDVARVFVETGMIRADVRTNPLPREEANGYSGLKDQTSHLKRLLAGLEPMALACGSPIGKKESNQGDDGGGTLEDLQAYLPNLSGKQRRVLELTIDKHPEGIPLADLAADSVMGWNAPVENGFQTAQREINKKIKPLGWRIIRRDNKSRLSKVRQK